MKTTPPSAQGFVNRDAEGKHQKLEKSTVARENDRLAEKAKSNEPPLHRKEDLSQGDEGVDDPS